MKRSTKLGRRKGVGICLCPNARGCVHWEVVCRAGQCHEHVCMVKFNYILLPKLGVLGHRAV